MWGVVLIDSHLLKLALYHDVASIKEKVICSSENKVYSLEFVQNFL